MRILIQKSYKFIQIIEIIFIIIYKIKKEFRIYADRLIRILLEYTLAGYEKE
jgi:hypothetical protein